MNESNTTKLGRNNGISKKTHEVLANIEKNQKMGITPKGAAAAAGISEPTPHVWNRKDPAIALKVSRR